MDNQMTEWQRRDLDEKMSALSILEQQYPELAKLRPLLKTDGLEFRRQYPQVLISAVSKSVNLPRNAIDVLGGKPYINKTGLTIKCQKDPRKVKRLDTQFVIIPIEMQQNIKIDVERHPYFMGFSTDGTAVAKGIVEFQDGSVYMDNGTANPKYLCKQYGKMSTMIPYVIELACTRALNRAMRLATGVGLVSVEELNERGFQTFQEKETNEGGNGKIEIVNEVEKLFKTLNINAARQMALTNKYGSSDLEFMTVQNLERLWHELKTQVKPVKKLINPIKKRIKNDKKNNRKKTTHIKKTKAHIK